MSKVHVVPKNIHDAVLNINKNLHPFNWKEGEPTPMLVPYLLDEDEDDWRCHLLDEKGNTLASYLQWEHLHWHVVSMFLSGFQARRKIDFKEGMQHAVNTLHENNQRALGLLR